MEVDGQAPKGVTKKMQSFGSQRPKKSKKKDATQAQIQNMVMMEVDVRPWRAVK